MYLIHRKFLIQIFYQQMNYNLLSMLLQKYYSKSNKFGQNLKHHHLISLIYLKVLILMKLILKKAMISN
jgi:hypothetical protein